MVWVKGLFYHHLPYFCGLLQTKMVSSGYIDFLPNLCYIDQITCAAAHGKLIRHKTLADGDGECNYWILGDKEPEAVADVGSK